MGAAGNPTGPLRLTDGRCIPARTSEGCPVIDDLWYKNGIFYCLSVGTYMDATMSSWVFHMVCDA